MTPNGEVLRRAYPRIASVARVRNVLGSCSTFFGTKGAEATARPGMGTTACGRAARAPAGAGLAAARHPSSPA